MLFRLTRDLFAVFIQQLDNISTDIQRRADLSVIAELLVAVVIVNTGTNIL